MHIVANSLADSSQLKRYLWVMLILAGMFALLWIYVQLLDSHMQWDARLLTWIQSQRHQLIDQLMLAITMIADLPMSMVLMSMAGIALLIRQQWWLCVYAGCAFFSTTLSVTIVKILVQRLRPSLTDSAMQVMSFPSGHAARAVIVLGILALLAGWGRSARIRNTMVLSAVLLSVSVALSRVYLGAHWPSDVFAGAMLAAVYLVGFHWQLQRLEEPSSTLDVSTVLTVAVLAYALYWWVSFERQGQLYGSGIS